MMTSLKFSSLRSLLFLSGVLFSQLYWLGTANAAEIIGGGMTENKDPFAISASDKSGRWDGRLEFASHQDRWPKLMTAAIVCVRVSGNMAWVTGVPNIPLPDQMVPVAVIEDNGKDGDLMTVWMTNPASQGVSNPSGICAVAEQNGLETFLRVTAGGITIRP